jgi:uncharacterized protein
MLGLRNFLVPAAGIGSNLSWILIVIGFWIHFADLVYLGIFLFASVVLFQLVNLPVECDASRRARLALLEAELVTPDGAVAVKCVLDAAALTYVAATLAAALTLLYFLFRAGLLGGRRR